MNGYYTRRLPHYQPNGYAFFITFRLVESLPLDVVIKLQKEKEEHLLKIQGIANQTAKRESYRALHKAYFAKFDKLLDTTSTGHHWLKLPEVANIVKIKIHSFDNINYDLISYCIMSNHVHLVIKLLNSERFKYPLTKILQLLKSQTAIYCNKELKRSGQFWQGESYDHVVRDSAELARIVNYILQNPVKAGIANEAETYEYSYFNAEKMQ